MAEPGLNQFWSCLRCLGVRKHFLVWLVELGRTSCGQHMEMIWTWEDFFLVILRWDEPVLAALTNIMNFCEIIFYLGSLHIH